MTIQDSMYTLGMIFRAIWPEGDVPAATLDTALRTPASGLALAIKTKAARATDQEQLGALIDRLPADLSDPAGGVCIQDQGPFWTGYYHYMAALDKSARLGPEHLAKAGRLLFGDRWQSDLARALGVGDRRVREWVSQERRIPPGVWADITALLRQRSSEGLALIAELAE